MSDTRVEELLENILVWTRASSFDAVGKLLERALPSDNMRLAYQALDGSKTIEKVKKECSIGSNTINALIIRCCSMGLMEKSNGVVTRLFDLGDFDLLPELPSGPEVKASVNRE